MTPEQEREQKQTTAEVATELIRNLNDIDRMNSGKEPQEDVQ